METSDTTIKTSIIFKKITEGLNQGYVTISLQGSSRSSKTYNTLIFLITYALRNSRVKISVVRATLPALRASAYVDFEDIMKNANLWNDKRMSKTTFTYTFPNNSVIEFFQASDEQRLRGRKRDVLFVNEANELTFPQWQQLKMRTSRFAIIDYNPSFSDEHWICGVNREPKTKHYITTYKDNPFLEQNIIDEIESLKWKNETLWRVFGLGLQAKVEGLVFENVVSIQDFPADIEKSYIGIDYGFTNDPTAIVRVAFDKNNIYVDEIAYNTKLLTSDIITILKNNTTDEEIISESADPRMIQEIYRARLNVKAVHKYGGSINAGIAKMQEFKICVSSKSVNVMKEFKNYTWAQDKEGKFVNSPIDYMNHAIDAIRYVVLEKLLGGRPKKLSNQDIYRAVY